MTVLTSEGNWRVQLDNCYGIAEVSWVVIRVIDCPSCSDSQCTTFYYITSISTRHDCVSGSTATKILVR